MTDSRKDFDDLGLALKGCEPGQMFGKPCLKICGKAFACFFQDAMVFKLQGQDHDRALGLEGSILFDPSGTGRAMKAWVQVTHEHMSLWEDLAKIALRQVKEASMV